MSDLKKENNKPTFYLLTAAILLASLSHLGIAGVMDFGKLIIAGALSPVISVVLVMLTNIIEHNIKHKLVFTRWKDEMPGCRSNLLCEKDPRIDLENAINTWPKLFSEDTSPKQRNTIWYQEIYKPVKDNPSVMQSHKGFLLYRDVFSGLVILFVGGLIYQLGCQFTDWSPLKYQVFFVLFLCSLVSMIVARNEGNRFVMNAFAAA